MNTRKYRLFIAMLMIMVSLSIRDLSAQSLELHGFYGWQLHGTAKLYDGDLRINEAPNYGGKLSVALSTTVHVELSYMRSDTEGSFYPYYGTPSESIKFSSNYIQVGGVQEVNLDKIRPFGTVALGTVIWAPKTNALSTKAQFHVALGGGVKIWLTDFLGIRIQGNMLMPMVFNGVGFGCGIGTGGSGCGGNLYTRITPFQGEFSGGVIFKISPN
jgi:hypothetical protein